MQEEEETKGKTNKRRCLLGMFGFVACTQLFRGNFGLEQGTRFF